MSAFSRGIARDVSTSLGRFLAILGICALGCGFFAGLRMAGPDMRASVDAYYDETRLWDLRVVSTQGLGEKDLERLSAVEGVSAAVGSTSVDVMARVGSEQVATRVATLPAEYVGSGTDGAGADEPTANQLILRSGTWPTAAGECVASADNPALPVEPGDVIEVLYEAGDGDVLTTEELTVTGTVSSSAYPYTVSFGSTTLGSGMIDQYLYVPADTFVEGTPYTEAYLRVEGADTYQSGGDRYQEVVGAVDEAIESSSDELAEARVEDLRADAQSKVDEEAARLADERAAAESELSGAREELDASAAKIADGVSRLAAGESELSDARSELDSQRERSASELAAAQAALDDAQVQIDAQDAALDDQAAQAEAARSAYESGLRELLASLSGQGIAAEDLASARSGVGGASAQVTQARDSLAPALEQLGALEGAGALTPEQQAQLDAARAQDAQLAAQAEALGAALAQIDQLGQARAAVDAYDSGRAQVAAAQAEVDSGREGLLASQRDARAQLASAQEQVDSLAAQLEQSRAEIAAAQAAYDEGEAAWKASRAEADERLAEAQEALDAAQAEVDALEPGQLYVLDRTQSEGIATYQADSERMDTIATVFPFMFFLVAALVSLTTMTRMVEDERVQIGTYKALGYGTARIAGKYLAYAGAAAVTGAALGVAVLSQVLPYIVSSAYGIIYAVPQLDFPLPIDPVVALTSGGLGVAVTLLATWAAVVSALRETPAALMQPRAPRAGRRILLERVRPLWRRLSFSWKVTCRNLFRYKKRLLMTVVGISGCAALLLVGLGLHDAIWDILDNQFGSIVHYDTTVSLDDEASAEDAEAVEGMISATEGAEVLVRAQLVNTQVGSVASDGTLSVQVVVPKDPDTFAAAVSMRERVSQEPLSLSGGGLVLGEKTANKLGVTPGDTVTLYGQDAVGTATGEGCELTVTGVTENYVGSVAYLSPEAWDELFAAGVVGSEAPSFSTIYATTSPDAAARGSLTDALQGVGHVSTVSFMDETVAMYREMLSAVDLIVAVLIVSAAALAFIVLYNLTNINIGERVREIATLKVLGFRRAEVGSYIFREIALLALIGDALGMVLGTWLEGFVIVTAEVDVVMFGRVIHPASYVGAFALTLVFSALVMLAMRRRLDGIDMVESLKSVD